MGTEVVTDSLLNKLFKCQKRVENPNARWVESESHKKLNYNVFSESEDETFILYLRQNLVKGMEDDFSCGLAWVMPSGENFTLVRYNGSSHNHYNKLEKEYIGYGCHIHKSSKRYLEKTGKADGFARKTDKYITLDGALYWLVRDFNIEGLDPKPDEPTLFDK